MIEVQHLTKFYGTVPVLRDVSFAVRKGEILGFLGPNGAGKTTTMRILACYMPATSGTATVAGFDVFSQSLEVRRRIGYLPESVPLYTDMNVASYLKFAAEVKGVPRGKRQANVGRTIERCGLGDVQHKFIRQLSKGYRQRVGLAQALVNEPAVVILDEPTVGLDPRQIVEIRNLIKSLGGEHTILLSSHNLTEVQNTCDRVVIIHRGKIVAEDSEQALADRMQEFTDIRLTAKGDPNLVQRIIASVPGVLSADALGDSPGDGAVNYLVRTAIGRDLRGDIVRELSRTGISVLELRAAGLTLEDIFMRIIGQEEEHGELPEDGPAPISEEVAQ